jgi:transcriptional regulator MftR-like protein
MWLGTYCRRPASYVRSRRWAFLIRIEWATRRSMRRARRAPRSGSTAVRRALGSLIDLYTARADRVLAAKRLALYTPAIRARLLDKHARWENGVTAELATRLGVDPERDPRPRLIAAVAPAGFSCAVTIWVTSEGREDLEALVDDALEAVAGGLDRRSRIPIG